VDFCFPFLFLSIATGQEGASSVTGQSATGQVLHDFIKIGTLQQIEKKRQFVSQMKIISKTCDRVSEFSMGATAIN